MTKETITKARKSFKVFYKEACIIMGKIQVKEYKAGDLVLIILSDNSLMHERENKRKMVKWNKGRMGKGLGLIMH